MKTLRHTCLFFIAASVAGTANINAQSISDFASSSLRVTGGDANVSNTRCSLFSGWLAVGDDGGISGTIVRRIFPDGRGTSNPTPVTFNISPSESKVFGPISNDGSRTNVTVWDSGGFDGSGGVETNVTTYYSADFQIATANTNFFIKGRAHFETDLTVGVVTNVSPGPQPETLVTNVFQFTNGPSTKHQSLGGVSFAAGGIRGVFDAD